MIHVNKKIFYLIGIGGVGMAGIAEILLNLGCKVYGSDICKTKLTDYLSSIGAVIYIGHSVNNIRYIKTIDIVIVSSAIHTNNIELQFAIDKKLNVITRAKMLSTLAKGNELITISGTHGKTTVSAMIAFAMQHAKLDPTFIIGGKFKNTNSGAKLGHSKYIVIESDESDGSFLNFEPVITVVTNIDNDHLENYDNNLNNLKNAFLSHINKIPLDGVAFLCSDNTHLLDLINSNKIKVKYITYGLQNNPNIKAINIQRSNHFTYFDVQYMGEIIGHYGIPILGIHNVLNSLPVIGVCSWLKIPNELVIQSIKQFNGTSRRLEIKSKTKGVTIIDDYGHHPTEIIVSIKAIKDLWPQSRLIVLFQPHRYTRTKNLLYEFSRSFVYADLIFILDIYSAGESKILDVTSELILNELKRHEYNVKKFTNITDLISIIRYNDIILTIGAGDIWQLSDNLVEAIQNTTYVK
ncbi:MAG: UDP-N-acetylmuramate--L-alanine ligase [Endomicrobium sp.]|jgi:UDP-N-acetylmuramate--alanine ligase|nr:UDP-N-acetylmuramate--L-alanine ligase [Endomicrobium sp.]